MSKYIKSKSNNFYKTLNSLNKRKNRYKERKFLIEGKKVVEEAILSSVIINAIIYKESKLEEVKIETNIDEYILNDSLFKELSSMENSEGIIALCEFLDEKEISGDNIVVLDKLNDPGNLGTIIRSSEAFGFNNILLTEGTVDIYNPKVLRGAMGSIFRQNIRYIDYEFLEDLKSKGYKIYAMALEDNSLNIQDIRYDDKIIVVIGNEANGISHRVKEIADDFVIIPMQGEIESLNAGVAASTAMFYFDLINNR